MNNIEINRPALGSGPGSGFTPFVVVTRANLERNAAAAEAVRIASAAATGAAVRIISHDGSVDGAGDSGGAAATVAPAAASRNVNAHDHSGKPKAAGDATPSSKRYI